MPMKGSGTSQLREIDRWDGGIGWIAYPDEGMQRASHALAGDDGGAWVVDPVDVRGVDDLLDSVGDVAGVVVCLDRHKRVSSSVSTGTNATPPPSPADTTCRCTSPTG